MPHRDERQEHWSTIAIPIAQNSSEYVPPPKICANVPTLITEVPGVVTWVAWEMMSVSPSNVNNVPSVVVNDAIPT